MNLPPDTEFDIDWNLPWLIAAVGVDGLVELLQKLMVRDYVYN
jgi:hypothetical protein